MREDLLARQLLHALAVEDERVLARPRIGGIGGLFFEIEHGALQVGAARVEVDERAVGEKDIPALHAEHAAREREQAGLAIERARSRAQDPAVAPGDDVALELEDAFLPTVGGVVGLDLHFLSGRTREDRGRPSALRPGRRAEDEREGCRGGADSEPSQSRRARLRGSMN